MTVRVEIISIGRKHTGSNPVLTTKQEYEIFNSKSKRQRPLFQC
jgi:hypothetical protein